MTNDLDDLLRTTFSGRAGTVASGPAWEGAPAARRQRGPWIAAAAAAVTVLGVAGGIAYLSPGSGEHGTAAGGDTPVRTTCTAMLPGAWSEAVANSRVTYQGETVDIDAVTPAGDVIGDLGFGTGHTTVVSVPATGQPRTLLTVPGNAIVSVQADNQVAVISTAPAIPANSPDSPVDRITVVDLSDGARTDLLDTLPPSEPRVVLPKYGAVLQDGHVYWSAGSSRTADRATVLAYDIAERHYSVVGHISLADHSTDSAELTHDVRRVEWSGGAVPAPHAPSDLPSASIGSDDYQRVFSDGRTSAWQDAGSATIHVATQDGQRTWMLAEDLQAKNPSVIAASGNYVFLDSVIDGQESTYVLDIRNGATAHLADGSKEVELDFPSLLSVHGVTLILDPNGRVSSGQFDPATLPELRC